MKKTKQKRQGKSEKKTERKEGKPGIRSALKNKKIVIIAASVVLALIVISLVCFLIKGRSFYSVLKDVDEIDAKYGMSIHDYDNGLAYLKFNPRFPDEINLDEFDGVIKEFDKIMFEGYGSAGDLLINARRELLESEKYYRLGTKTTKGITKDGFKCSDRQFVEEATKNFNLSVLHGKHAVSSLQRFIEKSPDQAEMIGISKFWVKYLDASYDMIQKDAKANREFMIDFCSKKKDAENINQTVSETANQTNSSIL